MIARQNRHMDNPMSSPDISILEAVLIGAPDVSELPRDALTPDAYAAADADVQGP